MRTAEGASLMLRLYFVRLHLEWKCFFFFFLIFQHFKTSPINVQDGTGLFLFHYYYFLLFHFVFHPFKDECILYVHGALEDCFTFAIGQVRMLLP